MAVRETGHRVHRGDADGSERALRALRTRWRTASLATGWRFPGDWALPEVDVVCSLAVRCRAPDLPGAELAEALTGLGRARAEAGIGLDETLNDLAALHAALSRPPDELLAADPDATPARLLRLVALAWADGTLGECAEHGATEALTGLATPEYLRTRLGEVYRAAARDGGCPSRDHVLLAVALDPTEVAGWSRLMAMVLVADVLRLVFDGGESVAVLGRSVAAVLARRDDDLADRTSRVRFLLAERLAVDPNLAGAPRPRLRTHRLPACHRSALELVVHLGAR